MNAAPCTETPNKSKTRDFLNLEFLVHGSEGGIRTHDQLVTRYPYVSIQCGLYHHPSISLGVQGASISE